MRALDSGLARASHCRVLDAVEGLMELLLRVLQAENSDSHEEVFSAISAVSDVVEVDFTVSSFNVYTSDI